MKDVMAMYKIALASFATTGGIQVILSNMIDAFQEWTINKESWDSNQQLPAEEARGIEVSQNNNKEHGILQTQQ